MVSGEFAKRALLKGQTRSKEKGAVHDGDYKQA